MVAWRVWSWIVFAGISVLTIVETSNAQENPGQKRFDTAVDRLRAAIKTAQRCGFEYYHSPAAEQDEWREGWQKAADEGKLAATELKAAALEILFQPGTPSPEIVSIANRIQVEVFDKSQYEEAFEIAARLHELEPDNVEFQRLKAGSAILTNHFEDAKEFLTANSAIVSSLPKPMIALFRDLDELQSNYQQELAIREAEAVANDLPQVELETSQGKIVLELFENQAPETVNNFVFLVESNFFDDVFFHRVLKNVVTQSTAQAGLHSMRGPQDPGYTIRDEYQRDDARHHFRGVISLANVQGVPNSGSGQFFLTFVPTPYLDGHHTVFGRIISDLRVLDKIHPTFTVNDKGEDEPIVDMQPDRILRARVLRKRDHEYQPNRIPREK